MNIEVFDKTNRLRIGIITIYSYSMYSEEFNGSGSFNISIPDMLYSSILKKGNYILFNQKTLGIIKYVGVTLNRKNVLQVKGTLLNDILSYRVIKTQASYSGYIESVCENMISENFINPSDEKRKLLILEIDPTQPATTEQINKSVTGKTVFDSVSDALSTKDYGFSVTPRITTYDEASDNPTNISKFVVKILHPTDRSVGNTSGNDPVVFSLELNNLKELFYDMDATQECTVAIVAGEGEGVNRKVIEVGDTAASGIDRMELYVDARDLQDATDAELTQRGLERMEDHKEFTSFDCTLLDSAAQGYGKKFFLGDYVTVIDKRLDISMKTQIIQVIHSSTGSDDITDIVFGNQKPTVQKLIKKGEI